MSKTDCLFCGVVAGTVPAEQLYEDADTLVFRDIHPAAPEHWLVIPKRHVDNLAAVGTEEWPLVAACLRTAAQVAERRGLGGPGYRVVANIGPDAGQSVPHLHWHVLGGRAMQWPPG